jgi:hypothetical protein
MKVEKFTASPITKELCEAEYVFRKACRFSSTLSHMNPCRTFPSCFFNIRFNDISQSTPTACRWSLSFTFIQQNPLCIDVFTIRDTFSAHLILLDLCTVVMFYEEYKS